MTTTDARTSADIERAVATLGSERRGEFLASLLGAVTGEARAAYRASGSVDAAVSDGFSCLSELLQTVGSQLLAAAGVGDRVSDRALVDMLVEEAGDQGCPGALRAALAGVRSTLEPRATGATANGQADVRDWAVAYLESSQRFAFLVELLYWLSLETRGLYPADGTDARRAAAASICYGEAVHKLATQLRADVAPGPGGFPDRALIEAMLWDAKLWGCEKGMRQALADAVAAVER